jgi:transcription-repair coupling factor (superfamily II helicase)
MKDMGLPEPIEKFISGLMPPPGQIYNLAGSSTALFLALQHEPFVMSAATEEGARELMRNMTFYINALGAEVPEVCFLPAPNGSESAGLRANVVNRITGSELCSLITSEEALASVVWSPEDLGNRVVRLNRSMEIERDRAVDGLLDLGYIRVPLVTDPGQFSQRGWILDIFPSTSERPYRVEFFGDEIEGIREFDVETQRSVEEVDEIVVMPAAEPEDGIMPDTLLGGINRFCSDNAANAGHYCEEDGAVVLSRYNIRDEGVDAGLLPMGGYSITPEERKDIYGLSGAIKAVGSGHRVVIVASSGGQAERLKDVLSETGVIAPIVGAGESMQYEGRVSITSGDLSSGIFLPGLLLLTEQEIFGGRPPYRPIRKSRVAGLMPSIDDLRTGDFVVHEDRGVGRFEGLVHQEVEGHGYDLLIIEYAEGDRLHLPVDGIDRIRKYLSGEGASPELDSLRTKKWQKTRERVRKRIREMAEKLIKIYADREVAKGFSFSEDTEMHREFDSFFLYEETPDQLASVRDIKKDMEAAKPMERLLSGDVGYGKTEVAMRAAFKAIYDGKQVAVLVPTTLLCEQHTRIFRKRFSGFPVNIDYLSRFKTRREKLETIERLRMGDIDIIIATHAMFKPDVRFHDLGLLIIDEEHRFGVRQKDRTKELKRGVDALCMSATPIPRSLQMSLSGIRGMSVIETPPEERLSVRSEVAVYNETLIRSAIDRELSRGGQVFFVHNRIMDIDRVQGRLRKITPLARIAIAHGQMPEKELESIMLSFLNREVDVLLCTAIIGSGLDIPTANTIIINMAHRMGLSDLYQLRGRVGRSSLRGYAYYLIPGSGAVTDEARMRLQALQDFSYMGAGLRLALKDLEIRGAGNLLGTQQSGYIRAVGFDMYVHMLEQAVAELKGMDIREKTRPEIGIRLNAFIPDDYIEDMMLRLSVYRKISAARNEGDLDGISEEMADRFGPPPEPFLNLLRVMGLSLRAAGLSITCVKLVGGKIRFLIAEDSAITAGNVMDAFGGKAGFRHDGFELKLKGDVYNEVDSSLMKLQKLVSDSTLSDST